MDYLSDILDEEMSLDGDHPDEERGQRPGDHEAELITRDLGEGSSARPPLPISTPTGTRP